MLDVVCALIEMPGKGLLACKRAQDSHLGGCWEFPGGKIEPGESAAAALQREIEEELEIRIEVGQALGTVEWDYGTVAIRLHPYCCRILEGKPVPHVHAEIRWCKPEQMDDLNWAPADRPILAEWHSLKPE